MAKKKAPSASGPKEQRAINLLLETIGNLGGSGGVAAAGNAAASPELVAAGGAVRGYVGRPTSPDVLNAAMMRLRAQSGGKKPKVRVMGGLGREIEGVMPSKFEKAVGKLGLSKGGAKVGIAGVVGTLLLKAVMGKLLAGQQREEEFDLANRQMDVQAESMPPEAMTQEALQPITRAQLDFAMQMLMQQLGQRPPRNRARGEAWT